MIYLLLPAPLLLLSLLLLLRLIFPLLKSTRSRVTDGRV